LILLISAFQVARIIGISHRHMASFYFLHGIFCLLKYKSFEIWWSSVYHFFLFLYCAFNIMSKKSLPNPWSQRFCPMSSFYNF
jgi:hypothetical protein